MQLAWISFSFPYVELKSPFVPSMAKKTYFSTYTHPTSYTTREYVDFSITTHIHQVWWSKFKIVSGFHVTLRDPWSLTFYILETFQLGSSMPFEGYKLSHIQAMEEKIIQLLERKDTLEKFHFTLSLHPFILKSLNTLFNPQALLSLMDNLIVSFIWACLLWRIQVVEAQLEGLRFSVPVCASTKVCHICTYVDHFNRNTIFSSNWYLENIWIVIPWAYFSWMLMDYANLYSNMIYHHHMLAYLGCWGKVIGVKL